MPETKVITAVEAEDLRKQARTRRLASVDPKILDDVYKQIRDAANKEAYSVSYTAKDATEKDFIRLKLCDNGFRVYDDFRSQPNPLKIDISW